MTRRQAAGLIALGAWTFLVYNAAQSAMMLARTDAFGTPGSWGDYTITPDEVSVFALAVGVAVAASVVALRSR